MENSLPYVICYMAPSVDGRLRFDRFTKSFYGWDQDENILKIYDKIGIDELQSNAILIGRTTYCQDFCQELYDTDSHKIPATKFEPFKAAFNNKDFFIIADSKGKSTFKKEALNDHNYITILGEQVSEDYLQYLRENNISYVFSGKDGHDLEKALSSLKSLFGINRLLLEGGGILNGSFLKSKLIDEIALLMMPSIDGMSGQPSIFECQGNPDDLPASGQKLEFMNVKTLDYGIILIRYKVHK